MMEGSKSFAEIWKQAHRERSKYVLAFFFKTLPDPDAGAPRKDADRLSAKPAIDLGTFGLPIGLSLIVLSLSIAIFFH